MDKTISELNNFLALTELPITDKINKTGLTRIELNFIKLPLFTLDRSKVGAKQSLSLILAPKVIDGEEKQVKFTISPPVDYGLGGPFDYAAFRAVEYILSKIYESKGKLSNPIALGSGYNILKIMGEGVEGKNYKRLKTFFCRMRSTLLNVDYSIYNKEKKNWLESMDSDFIYRRVILVGEEMPDGNRKADQIYLWLSDFYLANLNSSFVKLVDYEFYKSLNLPLTRRFFEILSVYAHKYNSVKLKYSELCLRVPMQRQKHISLAKQAIARPLAELIEKGLIREYEILPVADNPTDWQIKFVFGESKSKFNVELEQKEEASGVELRDYENEGIEVLEVPTAKKEKKQKEPSEVTNFLHKYKKLLDEYRGIKAFIEYARDGKIVKDMLNAYGIEKLERLLLRYIKLEDHFVKSKGYPIALFRKKINDLAIAEEEASEYAEPTTEILSYLYQRTDRDFTTQIDEIIPLVAHWMRKDKSIEDFKEVIDNMSEAWGDDPHMRNYLRPSTLFGKKMEEYLTFNKNGRCSPDYVPGKYANYEEVVYVDFRGGIAK